MRSLRKKAIILAIISTYCLGCRTVFHMNTAKEIEEVPELWVEQPNNGAKKAIVILLHGLNLKPQKMDDWANMLKDNGALVLRLALFGHHAPGTMHDASAEIWRKQFDEAISKAAHLAQEEGLNLYFIGFSLGALVGLEWLAQSEEHSPKFNKMVLIAPAVATPWYSKGALILYSIFGKSFSLPSRSPKEYRANNGSTLGAYKALFDLKSSLEKNGFEKANIPTLIFIDKHDELVPSMALKQIIEKHRLGQWQLDILDNKVAFQNHGFRHLLVDQASVGKELWETIVAKVKHHFEL